MREFCALYEQLDRSPGTNARVEALQAYFAAVDPADGAWALSLLLGKRRKRLLTGRRLREIALAAQLCPNGCSTTATARWATVPKPSPCCCPSWRCPKPS